MSGFEDRKKGEEGKFAFDAELRFKATARRDKLLGQWVGKTFLGKTDSEAEAFGQEVVRANFERPGDDDVVEFILRSVEGTGADFSEHRLRHKMEELMREAERQISEG
ncbi:MAG: hypothetical protein CMM47_09500 [Rhodospirillaceae bacterium]|nr:hypothetical protein [Rhodospirillaceae bacterium]